ncbi:hypothetical protein [Macrococcus carouselicus]|uniref:Uncharacterized protein n=1 Tax=Macrococcus carouselicus TaxID=69969 RepID=A0A9Q8FQS9_9STAP|nr:hypothetical protein [Macrococcus carouselicus]TDM04102.1 hypothetical protein ERX40_02735 [Macrococcus carouselicus]
MARDLQLAIYRIDDLLTINTTMKMKSEFVYANTFKDYLVNVYREEILIRDYDTMLLAYDEQKVYAYIKDHEKLHFISCNKQTSEIEHAIYQQPVEKIKVNVSKADPLCIESVEITIKNDNLTLINSNNNIMFNRFISKL